MRCLSIKLRISQSIILNLSSWGEVDLDLKNSTGSITSLLCQQDHQFRRTSKTGPAPDLKLRLKFIDCQPANKLLRSRGPPIHLTEWVTQVDRSPLLKPRVINQIDFLLVSGKSNFLIGGNRVRGIEIATVHPYTLWLFGPGFVH